MALCCIPNDIVHCRTPDILDPKSAVPVFCSNALCWQSGLVHPGCFYKWEDNVVRYLASEEIIGTDTRVMDSLLWTKQMWDLPLPFNLTACKCGDGSLRRMYEDDELNETELSKVVSGSAIKILENSGQGVAKMGKSGDGKLRGWEEECSYEIQSDREGSWEVVSREKSKKKSNIPDSNTPEKKPRRTKLSPKNHHYAQPPKAGPDPVSSTAPVPSHGQAEGRRDSSGLIHCCSCQTVHPSLPHFIQHCKTGQHTKLQGVGDVYTGQQTKLQEVGDVNNNNVVDVTDLKRDVEQLKRGVVELMKQGLEKDILVVAEFDEFRESFKFELKKSSGILALLIEKFQELEEKYLKIDEKMSSLILMVENNEKDVDSCFDCFQDLTQNINGLSKEFKSFQKKTQVAQNVFEVKIKEIEENLPRMNKSPPDVDHVKPMKAVTICNLAFAVFILTLVPLVSFMASAWL